MIACIEKILRTNINTDRDDLAGEIRNVLGIGGRNYPEDFPEITQFQRKFYTMWNEILTERGLGKEKKSSYKKTEKKSSMQEQLYRSW